MHAPCCACAPLRPFPTRRSRLGASRAAGSHLAQRRGLWVLQDTEVAPRYTGARYSGVLTARQGVRHSPASARQLLAVEEVRLVRVVRHARERLVVGQIHPMALGWLQASPGSRSGMRQGRFRGEPSAGADVAGVRPLLVQMWAAASPVRPRADMGSGSGIHATARRRSPPQKTGQARAFAACLGRSACRAEESTAEYRRVS